MRQVSMLATAVGFAMALASTVQAAEIKLMSSVGVKIMLIDLAADFERATTHKDHEQFHRCPGQNAAPDCGRRATG
jgi:hypothetical protein